MIQRWCIIFQKYLILLFRLNYLVQMICSAETHVEILIFTLRAI